MSGGEARRQRGNSARLVEVLEVITLEGEGMGEVSIYRNVTRYYAKDGTLLATSDPCPNSVREA